MVSTPAVGTNHVALPIAFQEWCHFKEAYTPELVHRAIVDHDGNGITVVNPFSGSGTTAITSQFLGAFPIVIEVNPYLADLTLSKRVDLPN